MGRGLGCRGAALQVEGKEAVEDFGVDSDLTLRKGDYYHYRI